MAAKVSFVLLSRGKKRKKGTPGFTPSYWLDFARHQDHAIIKLEIDDEDRRAVVIKYCKNNNIKYDCSNGKLAVSFDLVGDTDPGAGKSGFRKNVSDLLVSSKQEVRFGAMALAESAASEIDKEKSSERIQSFVLNDEFQSEPENQVDVINMLDEMIKIQKAGENYKGRYSTKSFNCAHAAMCVANAAIPERYRTKKSSTFRWLTPLGAFKRVRKNYNNHIKPKPDAEDYFFPELYKDFCKFISETCAAMRPTNRYEKSFKSSEKTTAVAPIISIRERSISDIKAQLESMYPKLPVETATATKKFSKPKLNRVLGRTDVSLEQQAALQTQTQTTNNELLADVYNIKFGNNEADEKLEKITKCLQDMEAMQKLHLSHEIRLQIDGSNVTLLSYADYIKDFKEMKSKLEQGCRHRPGDD